MVVILRRAAASLVVGASLLSGAAQAQLPCWDAATTPVRRLFQDNRYGAGEMQRAMEEIRLNQRRVELEVEPTDVIKRNDEADAFKRQAFPES